MAPAGVEPALATCIFDGARVPLMKGSVGGLRAAGLDRRGRRPSPPLGMWGGGWGAAASGHVNQCMGPPINNFGRAKETADGNNRLDRNRRL